LYRNYVPADNEFFFTYYSDQSVDYDTELSDIWFEGPEPRTPDNSGGADSYGIEALSVDYYQAYIHGCRFKYFNRTTIRVHHKTDSARTVISDNVFQENAYWDGSQWNGAQMVAVSSNDGVWPDVTPGTNNMVFVEDNYTDGRIYTVVVGSQAGRYVSRHNAIDLSLEGPGESAHNMHPSQPEWLASYQYYEVSTRYAEVYNNVIVPRPLTEGGSIVPVRIMASYGGECLLWGNTIRNAECEVFLGFSEHWSDECSTHANKPADWTTHEYPVPYQAGYLSGVNYGPGHTGTDPSTYGEGDVFCWNNSILSTIASYRRVIKKYEPDQSDCPAFDGYLQENRDYHLDTERPNYTPYTYPHPRRT
jgi:hypothetical protein